MAQENREAGMEHSLFTELMRKKKRFLIPTTTFFLVFYFMLPILTAYTDLLETKAVGVMNWAYLYAFAQFAMTWIVCLLYLKRARSFDLLGEQLKQEMLAQQKGE
ncbi:MAG: DUF485 domain-containing protein [Brevibacillus sp.]|nr:DUF485 domain-containing protein [Brevibacillus sp.]